MEVASHTTTSRRVKRLIVSWELFRDLFTAGEHPSNCYRIVRDAIPADAILVNVRYAWPHCIELLMHSDSFPEIKEGDTYPLLEVAIETIQ